MSQDPPFSDDPLPGLEPQAKTPGAATGASDDAAPAWEEASLHDPDLKPQSSYGRSDPASMAAVQTAELAHPELRQAQTDALGAPDLRPSPGHSLQDFSQATPGPAPAGANLSNVDPHLAHLTQVGLVAADQWEEQIKPRIEQLHSDIDLVNEQLDQLDKAKRKIKKS
jgi:hypothetical protein